MEEKNTNKEELNEVNLPQGLRVTPFSVPDMFFNNQKDEIFRQINFNTPSNLQYSIPENYFDTLQDNILSKIAEENLKSQIQDTGFSVPEHYFENLSSNIKLNINIENIEIKSKQSEYLVPENYFDNFEERIQSRIFEENLKSQVSNDGFATPDNYFESLNDSILAEVFVEKLQSNTINKDFITPENYFEHLSSSIKAKTESDNTVKTLDKKIIIFNNWKKAASIAAAVFLVSIGSYIGLQENNLFISNANSDEIVSDKQQINLATISDEEIVSYLAEVSDEQDLMQLAKYVDSEIKDQTIIKESIKSEDIEDYLNYML